MPVAIEEYRPSGQALGLEEIAGHDRPLVLRGLCADWPLVRLARQSDTAFAQQLAGWDNGADVNVLRLPPAEGGVVGYDASCTGFNYEHFQVSVTQVLQRLASYSRQPDPPGLALQSALIADCLPGFLRDHALPFLDAQIQPRLWLGNRVTTPAHFDEYANIACVVCGSRRFTLFPPGQVRNLYVGPLDFAPTGAAISMARLDQVDDPRFPRLREALAHAQVTELLPGDAIFVPPLWWHHVTSLQQINALVNYWWIPGSGRGRATPAALDGLLHAILSFKSLDPADRAAWRALLEHYVFGEEDPAAHIPEHARGILGPLTPERVEQLKGMIRRYL
ncbi:cupin-like domain-containing protein [Rhodanobacter ginsengiterrae]|uniref:cupin-like domain-containing protein n=1 Tax=Rhodanobacter ginsengiterrae TaxID=2008451 RepID=UPI003CFBB93B